MTLNHVNLTVPDVLAARDWFEKHFDLRCVSTRGTDRIAVLIDDAGSFLTLSNFDRAEKVQYPGIFHIGFMQDSRQKVDEIHARLAASGTVADPPREFHGAWTFYVEAPGGILVEVGYQHKFA